MQKAPKDVPSFGNLPDREPQAKARVSDARFRSPAHAVQICELTTVRAEPGLRHCSALARINIHFQKFTLCECNGQYGSPMERSDANRRCTALGKGDSKGGTPLAAFASFSAAKRKGPSGLRTIANIKIFIDELISD